MIVKEFDYVQGNTVIKPQRKSTERDRKKYEELKRSKKNRNRRLLEKKKNRRSAMLQIALTILIAGTVIISRDAKVYGIQKSITETKVEIKNITAENEAIKIDLLKFSSLENIKTNAEEKLGMIVSTKDSLVEIDMSGNYFQELDDKEAKAEKKEKKGFFSKIMDALM